MSGDRQRAIRADSRRFLAGLSEAAEVPVEGADGASKVLDRLI